MLSVPCRVLVLALLVSAAHAEALKPPTALSEPHVSTLLGQQRSDEYFWLRQRERPELMTHLEAENAYTTAMLAHTATLQQQLFEELKSRIQETDLTPPVRIDDYFYYDRTEQGRQYSIQCRKKGSLDAKEEILLDPNELARDHKYFRVGLSEVSPDHSLLAYGFDTNGAEQYELVVKDLASGTLRPDRIPQVSGQAAWANDNATLFYVKEDAARRPWQVWRHTLGDASDADQLVYQENDGKFGVSVDRSRSKLFLFIASESKTTSEARFVPADEPRAEPRLVTARAPGVEYSVEHHGDRLFIVTNADGATNFKLMSTPVERPGREHWRELAAYDPNVKIDGVDAFADYLIVYERMKGLPRIRVRDLRSDAEHLIAFDEPAYSVGPGQNPEFNSKTLRFGYSSLVTPRCIYDYELGPRTRVLLKQQPVLGGYDPANYETQRLFATATDGVQVPISVVCRKGTPRDGSNPLLLKGYGSYGAPIDAAFSGNTVSLLDRGFVYAFAHVRGGGELGRTWYESGKLLNKKNTFSDFIACAEHLIKEGYTSPQQLAIQGGSAGGLLIGAVLNARPDLFHAAIANVPFVDVVNSMMDETLPLTVTEYEEWGNPIDDASARYMLEYSPYDNVRAQPYPHLLVTSGINDPRVAYWEPVKWVARLRQMNTSHNPILLKMDLGAGHGGASGRYDRLREVALEFAYLIDRLQPPTNDAGTKQPVRAVP